MEELQVLLKSIAGLGAGRRFIALAGPPGSGKSTLAARLVALVPGSVIVPMDGFHLDNLLLEQAGLHAVKGAPITFDAAGFLAMVFRAKAGEEVIYPVFDRDRDLAIAGAGRIAAGPSLVIFEGNYLLLDQPHWRELSGLWDLSVMLHVPLPELSRRLTARWQGLGCSADEVSAHLRNDLANAALVLDGSLPADLALSFLDETH